MYKSIVKDRLCKQTDLQDFTLNGGCPEWDKEGLCELCVICTPLPPLQIELSFRGYTVFYGVLISISSFLDIHNYIFGYPIMSLIL